MSDEKRRIFTHPDIVQAGDYGARYRADLMCSVCRCVWGKHIGWACDGPYIESLPEQPSRVTTTCARCSATIDPEAVEQHHERCFRVGDEVRSTHRAGIEVDGTIVSVVTPGIFGVRIAQPIGSMKVGSTLAFGSSALRRIQWPGQAVREAQERYALGSPLNASPMTFDDIQLQDTPLHFTEEAVYRAGAMQARTVSVKVTTPEPNCTINGVPAYCPQSATDPLDVVYDGLSLRALLLLDECDRRESAGPRRRARRTDAQRAAVSAHWSADLRQRISAAKERERLTVMMPIDVEDLPWR